MKMFIRYVSTGKKHKVKKKKKQVSNSEFHFFQ